MDDFRWVERYNRVRLSCLHLGDFPRWPFQLEIGLKIAVSEHFALVEVSDLQLLLCSSTSELVWVLVGQRQLSRQNLTLTLNSLHIVDLLLERNQQVLNKFNRSNHSKPAIDNKVEIFASVILLDNASIGKHSLAFTH